MSCASGSPPKTCARRYTGYGGIDRYGMEYDGYGGYSNYGRYGMGGYGGYGGMMGGYGGYGRGYGMGGYGGYGMMRGGYGGYGGMYGGYGRGYGGYGGYGMRGGCALSHKFLWNLGLKALRWLSAISLTPPGLLAGQTAAMA